MNPFFPLTILFGGMFIVTILALVASLLGDPRAPLAQLLDRHAGWLLVAEVVATLATGFLALVVDRRQTLAKDEAAKAGPARTRAADEDGDPGGTP
jgi:hypothetical protein